MASLLTSSSSSGTATKTDPSTSLSNAIARIQSAGQTPTETAGGSQSFLQQAEGKGLGLLSDALNFINRPSQAVLKGVQAEQLGGGLGQIASAAKQGIEGKGTPIDFRQALLTDNFERQGMTQDQASTAASKFGGALGVATDFLGSGLTDPTTYIGAGAIKDVGKAGLKALDEGLSTAAPDLAAKISQNGGKVALSKVLNPDELATARQTLENSSQGALAKAGPQKFADQALSALDQPAGLKVVGKTVLPLQTLKPLSDAARITSKVDDAGNTISRGAAQIVKESKPAEAITRAFNTYTDTAKQFGNKIANSVKQIQISAGSQAANETVDTINQLNRLAKIAKVSDADVETARNAINDGTSDLVSASLRKAGQTAKADYVDKLAEVYQAAKNVKSSAVDELGQTANDLRGTANDAVKNKAQSNIDVSSIRNEIRDTQQELAAYRGEGIGGKVPLNYTKRFEDAGARLKGLQSDLKKAERSAGTKTNQAIRATNKASGAEDLASRNFISLTRNGKLALMNSPGAVGRELGIDSTEVRSILNSGFLPKGLSTEDFEKAVQAATKTKKDIVEKNFLKHVATTVQGAAEQKATSQAWEHLAQLKDSDGESLVSHEPKPGYDLVETPGGKIYVPSEIKDDVRHVSAVINSDRTIAGFGHMIDEWNKLWRAYATVPLIGGVGFHARNMYGNIFNNVLAGVKNPAVYKDAFKLQTAITKAVKSPLDFSAALRQQGLTGREVEIIERARQDGTIGNFLVEADQHIDPVINEVNKAKRAAQLANPLSRNGAVIKTGTAVGHAIETNARLALYLDQVNKHGDYDLAAQTVRKYLFDYGDLTPFEQHNLRRFIPFYTYMRKNTALQIAQLAQKPGYYATLAKAQNEANIQGNQVNLNGKNVPQYALGEGLIPILGGKNPLLAGINTPFQAATQTLQPLADLIGMVQGKTSKQQTASDVVNTVGGAPAELSKFAIEEATGKDLFTGQDISKESQSQTWLRLGEALSPATSKIASDAEASGDADATRARLISALTGLTTVDLSDQKSDSEVYRRLQNVDTQLSALKSQGVNVPTTQQLQKAGVIPKSPKKASIKKAKSSGRSTSTSVKKVSTRAPSVKKVKIAKPGQKA